MLKKQTVWLLTMLSLVVVLSVYYVTTPDKMNTASPATGEKIGQEKQGTDKAVTNETPNKETTKETPSKETPNKETTNKETDKKENAKKKQVKRGDVSVQSSDENFTALRMQMEDKRSAEREKLQNVIKSSNATAEERSKAKDGMDAIATMETKEGLLETVIKAQGGYKDALVRADGTDIRVTVKAAKHSQKEANKIIQLVRSEGGSKDVGVKFDPSAK
ncbi:Stage III sporulation protein AH [Bacillus cereus Rock1-3]|nr:Stage III sporulation protein AH [Bacillus cereus Rock1-3]